MWATVNEFVKRNPLATFVLLAYLLSWWPYPLLLMGAIPFPIASFGPFLAALIVLAMTRGRGGIMRLLREMVRWRVGWPWYVVALGLPILMAVSAAIFTVMLGAPAPTSEQVANWPDVFMWFPFALLVPGLSGAWEEPGWRGYAANQLAVGRTRLWALVPLWAIIVVWHLPLFLQGAVELVDVLNMVGGVILYNWLYYQSGRSVLLVMIIHAMNNSIAGEFLSPMFSGEASVQFAWMRTLVWGIAAVVVLVVYWQWWNRVPDDQFEAAAPLVGQPVTPS
jgi:membrane protease YdiL (CAAX protease family)